VQALRVLKPDGYLLAFSGSRTYHRMVCAIEDAGFEIRNQIMWIYGSGFPKSHNGDWGGTALKPAHEPIVMARKPLIGTAEANWREQAAFKRKSRRFKRFGAPMCSVAAHRPSTFPLVRATSGRGRRL
jgi:DNA modification methylase